MENKSKTIETYNKIAKEFSKTHFNTKFWEEEFNIFKNLIKGNKIIEQGRE